MKRQENIKQYFSESNENGPVNFYQIKPKNVEIDIHNKKICSSIEESIRKSGLKDGMTISFHHAFREGDYIINMVMEQIAKMGFKDLVLASSSLSECHSPLIKHIENGVIKKIYTSGMRGELANKISEGLMNEPIIIHSHGGRVNLLNSGELHIDVAFLGVYKTDNYGNATGKGLCGSLGYAMIDARYADKVVLLSQELETYPLSLPSIHQDQVDYIVLVDEVGDPTKIGGGATRLTSNPRDLLIAKKASEVIINSKYFKDGFSLQTGSGGASLAVTRYLEEKMVAQNIKADFALGGITSTMVKLHQKGLIKKLLDVQSFDHDAAISIEENPNHIEISANEYANFSSKGASVDLLDIVILSALEIDLDFNINVITGSEGYIRGASGGHCDTAASAKLVIIVAPLVRSRIPTIRKSVKTCITPGSDVDVIVTDHGIAINPRRIDLIEHFESINFKVFTLEELYEKGISITGEPKEIKTEDRIVGIIKYRDGSIIDVIHQVLIDQ